MPPLPGYQNYNPFYSPTPANTAMSVANLYEQPLGMPMGLGQLTPDPTRIPYFSSTPANTAAGLENLYGGYPQFSAGRPASGLPRLPLGAGNVQNLYLPSNFPAEVPVGIRGRPPVPRSFDLGLLNNPESYADDALRQATRSATTTAANIPTTGELAALAPAERLTGRALAGRLAGIGGRAIGRGVAGTVAGNLAANFVPGEGALSQAAQGALRGAGLGYTFGPWGALAGGVIGGVGDALNIGPIEAILGGGLGGEAPDPQTVYTDSRSRIESAFTAMGIPDEQRNQFWRGVNASLQLAGDDEDARNQVIQGLIPAAESVLSTYESQANSGAPRMSPQDVAQIQAMVGMFTQPYAQQYVDTANQTAGFINAAAENLPPAYRGILQAQAAQQVSSANRYAAALQQQAAVLPSMSAYQMAISQAYQQPQGGAGDLSSILANLPAA